MTRSTKITKREKTAQSSDAQEMTLAKASEILGVQFDSSAEEIRKAFRRKSRDAHPDRGGQLANFIRFEKAREVLINAKEKLEIDGALFGFKLEINQIDDSNEFKAAAKKLVKDLEMVKNIYLSNQNRGAPEYQQFMQDCANKINQHKPKLSKWWHQIKNLGLGLLNVLKAIGRTVSKIWNGQGPEDSKLFSYTELQAQAATIGKIIDNYKKKTGIDESEPKEERPQKVI